MSDSSFDRFDDSVAEHYDAHLGPYLFEFSATDIARRAASVAPTGGRVLEVACGTGIVTEHLSRALARGTEIVATDLNEGMLGFARSRRGALAGVTYQQADALALPFADASFDVVVCQFGLMFFPDKARGVREMARVLKPGGRVLLSVWDSLENNRSVLVARDTIASFFASDPPDFLDLPFGYYAIDPIEDLLTGAGLTHPRANVVRAEVTRPDALSPARGLVEGNPGVHEIRRRATVPCEEVVAAVARALAAAYGPPPLRMALQEIVFEAQKPGAA